MKDLSEIIGETGPRGVQRLLSDTTWDPNSVRDDLRDYVVVHLGDETTGVLIVDETGFLKKGKTSCGVAVQYTGTGGATANCQVEVFLACASAAGTAFIDRALYLPKNGRTTGHAGSRPMSPRTLDAQPRSRWRSRCWREHSTRTFPRAGSSPMPSMADRTSCGSGSKRAGIPTR
jgi:hypothetical protein